MQSKLKLFLGQFLIIFTVASFVLITSSSTKNTNAVNVEKNIMLTKEFRQVKYFDSVNMRGAYNVEIVSQKEQSIEIQAPEDILRLIETEVKDDVLLIFSKYKLPDDKKINIKVSAVNLRDIYASGANNIQVTNLKSERTNINFDGSSNSKISGETKELNVKISGQARLDTQKFSSQRVNLDLSGSVMVEVRANEELNIVMNGAGAIFYYGNPKIGTRNIKGPVTLMKR